MQETQVSKPKFRPVLTHAQLIHLISLCKKDMSTESIQCISVLAPYEYKIQNRAVSPSYTKESISISDSLGLGDTITSNVHPADLYETWRNDPSLLSLSELETAREYAYLNDLMSPEEEISYSDNLIQFSQKA